MLGLGNGMSHALDRRMDIQHHRHSATVLTIIAGAAGAAAFGAVIIGSCLGPDVATLDGGEPFVETVAGMPATSPAIRERAPSTTTDSTGGPGNVSLTSAQMQMTVDPRAADAAVKARK